MSSVTQQYKNLKLTREQEASQILTQQLQTAMTDSMYKDNVNFVRSQIALKSMPEPYFATAAHAKGVTTDYDEFPYHRYYRGYYASANPIIDQRAAGFRPRIDNCYKPEVYKKDPFCYPNNCFQGGTTVTYPCRPDFVKKFEDVDNIRQLLDTGCIIQYQ